MISQTTRRSLVLPEGCSWLGELVRLGLGLDLHFAVLVSVLQSIFMQLLSACGVRERVDTIFDLLPLDEALR